MNQVKDISNLEGEHIILAGPPGAGKATILNCIAQDIIFQSGQHHAPSREGPASIVQTVKYRNVNLSTTRSLSNSIRTKTAAKEIVQILSNREKIKLFFVITLESGRVKEEDIDTMKVILGAIESAFDGVSTNFKYSIIINKVSGAVIKQILSDSINRRYKLERLLNVGTTINSRDICYVTWEERAVHKVNFLLNYTPKYIEFFMNAPGIRVSSPIMDLAGQHIVVVGNPGAGKSTLLNCIAQRVLFDSGMSLGEGLTYALQTKEVSEVSLSDTPGLSDPARRQEAAQEISKILRLGGTMKLVFVISLEGTMIRFGDITTIQLILQSIRDIGIEPNYQCCLVVNKVDVDVLRKLDNSWEKTCMEAELSVSFNPENIMYNTFDRHANDANNFIMRNNEDIIAFLKRAPLLKLPEKSTIEVPVTKFDKQVATIREELSLMREKMNELKLKKDKKKFDSEIKNLRQRLKSFFSGIFRRQNRAQQS